MVVNALYSRLSAALSTRYQIQRELGAGGMATVYLARDMKHDRLVAIKVLRPELTASLGAERFLREIRVAAQLQHPHIVTLIDSGEADGLLYYVMPYVEGESLRARLTSAGTLSIEETTRVLRDIADALAYAHAHGVVHRDIKPENVMLSGRHALVLDFGVSKALSEATATSNLTGAGFALGTPAYMAPEQAAADPAVDQRADIYGLGIVGYEMLAGTLPFARGHVAPPPELRPDVPPQLAQVIMRSLERNPADRWADAGAVLEALERSPLDARRRGTNGRGRARRAAWAASAAVVVLTGFALFATRTKAPRGRERAHFVFAQVTSRAGVQQAPVWSPDAVRFAYTADAGPVRKIFIKRLDFGNDDPITSGPFDDIQPSWSPDGKTILFVRARQPNVRLEPGDVFGQYDGGDIWSVDVATGKAVRLVENGFNPAYSPDGRHIALDASWAGPRRIWVVDALGNNPSQITVDTSDALVHVRPHWSPDGRRIVYQNIERTNFGVRVVDVASRRSRALTTGLFQDVNPVWAPDGREIYFSSTRGGGWNLWSAPVHRDGTPSDAPQQITTGGGQDVDPAISADGTRLAFAILHQNADIWRLPVSPETGAPSGAPRPVISTSREDSRGAWSPNGRRIAFNSDRGGEMNIWVYSMAGDSTRQLTRGPGGDYQPNWSPDGTRIAFFSSRSGCPDIWTVDVATDSLTRLTHSPGIEVNPFFSPDGNHIAYQSDSTGRLEVWVMNADGTNPRQLTRTGVGGHFLRWTPDGQFVVYQCPCGGHKTFYQVPARGGEPEQLPEISGGAHLSFSPDHSRLMDVVGHKVLWVSPLHGGKPARVFAFDDPEVRIDYPVWSPDGKWVLFDRFRPEGGDIWVIYGVR